MKKLSRGMSLVEVVIAMAIIGIISLLVYRGISAGVNIISRGSKLMQDSTSACAELEQNIATKTNPVAGSITASIQSAGGSVQSVTINTYGYREEIKVGKETVYIAFFDNQREPFVPSDVPENDGDENPDDNTGDNTQTPDDNTGDENSGDNPDDNVSDMPEDNTDNENAGENTDQTT